MSTQTITLTYRAQTGPQGMHFPDILNPSRSACRRAVIDTTTGVPAALVPDRARCWRTGCAVRWLDHRPDA